MVIAQLATQQPSYKVALFLHCIGADALKIFSRFQFDSPDDRNDLAKIIQDFNEFTIRELNETFERCTFNSRNQQENEGIDAYVTVLRTLEKTFNFCDCMRQSSVTGSSRPFKITALANGFYRNGVSLSQSVSIFARALKLRICN